MGKTKRIKSDGERLVTRRQLHTALSAMALGADAAFSRKLSEMEDRLRAEFTVVLPPKEETPYQDVNPSDVIPTDSEGAE